MLELKNTHKIVFVLTAYLNIPDIEVRPSIDEVQAVLVQAGKIILSVPKGVGQWKKMSRTSKTAAAATKANPIEWVSDLTLVK